MFEIILGLAGVWILFSAKVPTWIVGRKGYEVVGMKARLVGLILALPFPISLVSGIVLILLFGKDGSQYALYLELAVFITDLIVASLLLRRFRTIVAPV
jgi:ABC-type sulfate transport system permease subunit